AQGRKLLRARLEKRGVRSAAEAMTALFVAIAAGQPAEAAVCHQTLAAAVGIATGKAAAAVASAGAARLFSIGLRAIAATKMKLMIGFALGAAFCLGGTGALA